MRPPYSFFLILCSWVWFAGISLAGRSLVIRRHPRVSYEINASAPKFMAAALFLGIGVRCFHCPPAHHIWRPERRPLLRSVAVCRFGCLVGRPFRVVGALSSPAHVVGCF